MASNVLRLRRALSFSSALISRSTTSASSTAIVCRSPIFRFPFSSPPPLPSTTDSLPVFGSRCVHSTSLSLSASESLNHGDDQIDESPLLYEGCDYKHWLIIMDFPNDPRPSAAEMVATYVQTLAKVFGSVEEAKKRMYACSTTTYTGFQAEMDEETSKKFEDMPGVLFVLPDSYVDPVSKEYDGDKYINGKIIPRTSPVEYGMQMRPRGQPQDPQGYPEHRRIQRDKNINETIIPSTSPVQYGMQTQPRGRPQNPQGYPEHRRIQRDGPPRPNFPSQQNNPKWENCDLQNPQGYPEHPRMQRDGPPHRRIQRDGPPRPNFPSQQNYPQWENCGLQNPQGYPEHRCMQRDGPPRPNFPSQQNYPQWENCGLMLDNPPQQNFALSQNYPPHQNYVPRPQNLQGYPEHGHTQPYGLNFTPHQNFQQQNYGPPLPNFPSPQKYPQRENHGPMHSSPPQLNFPPSQNYPPQQNYTPPQNPQGYPEYGLIQHYGPNFIPHQNFRQHNYGPPLPNFPSQQNYPQWENHGPMHSTPQQNFAPSQNYPPQQNYAPPQQNFAPPRQGERIGRTPPYNQGNYNQGSGYPLSNQRDYESRQNFASPSSSGGAQYGGQGGRGSYGQIQTGHFENGTGGSYGQGTNLEYPRCEQDIGGQNHQRNYPFMGRD